MIKGLLSSFFEKEKVINSALRQYISFFIIGIFCFLIDFSLLFLLKELLNQNVYVAVTIAFSIATYVNYLLNLRFVFEGGRHAKRKEFIYFFSVAAGSLLLTLLLMFVFVNLLSFYYLLAKTITVFLVSMYSFLMRKYLVFMK